MLRLVATKLVALVTTVPPLLWTRVKSPVPQVDFFNSFWIPAAVSRLARHSCTALKPRAACYVLLGACCLLPWREWSGSCVRCFVLDLHFAASRNALQGPCLNMKSSFQLSSFYIEKLKSVWVHFQTIVTPFYSAASPDSGCVLTAIGDQKKLIFSKL